MPTEPICRAAVVYLPLIRPCGATFSLWEKAKRINAPLPHTLRQGGFLCRRFCRCCWAGMPTSTAWPAAFMKPAVSAALPSAAARCRRWPAAALSALLCRTRRLRRIPCSPPRCSVWPHSIPAKRGCSSPVRTATPACWRAMPMPCAVPTALLARRPRPLKHSATSNALPPPAALPGCARPKRRCSAPAARCQTCRLAGRSSSSRRTPMRGRAAAFPGNARSIWQGTPPRWALFWTQSAAAATAALSSCRSTSPARIPVWGS